MSFPCSCYSTREPVSAQCIMWKCSPGWYASLCLKPQENSKFYLLHLFCPLKTFPSFTLALILKQYEALEGYSSDRQTDIDRYRYWTSNLWLTSPVIYPQCCSHIINKWENIESFVGWIKQGPVWSHNAQLMKT